MPDWAQDDCRHEDDYIARCQWLAAYLFTGNFEMTPRQAAYALSLTDKTAEHIARDLGEEMGGNIGSRDLLEMSAEEGAPFEEIENQEIAEWVEYKLEMQDSEETFDQARTTREEYEQICAEVEEVKRIGDVPNCADTPVRPLLALAVKRCQGLQQAEKVIRIFYDSFNEAAGK